MITEQQRQERKNGIFASDVAAILGKSAYKTAYQVWLEKTGRKELEDISDKPAVKWGNYLEEAVIRAFESERGLFCRQMNETLKHKEHSFLGCHLDALVTTPLQDSTGAFDGFDDHAVLEVKTASAFTADKWDNRVPDEYLLQVTMQMAITQLPKAYIATLIGGQDFRVYEFSRDEALESKVVDRLNKFYVEHVLADIPPPIITEKDTVLAFPDSWEGEVVANEELLIAVDTLQHIKDQIKELEAQQQQYRDKICSYIGKKDRLVDESGRIVSTWRSNAPSIKFNEKEFARKHEALYLEFMHEVPGNRPLLLKKVKK